MTNQSKVLTYLKKHPNEDLHIPAIAEEIGLGKHQTYNAQHALRTEKGYDVKQVLGGVEGYIRYIPRPGERVVGTRIFEEIGTTKSGEIIIQDEDGKILIARETMKV